MIFTKQVRYVVLLPVLISSLIIVLVAFPQWFYQCYRWIHKLQNFLSSSTQTTFETYSLVNGYGAQMGFQNLAIQQYSITKLFYKGQLGLIKQNQRYFDALDNSMQNSSYKVAKKYQSSWYNPITTNLHETLEQQNVNILSHTGFLTRAITRDSDTNMEQSFQMITFKKDGTSLFYPYFYTQVPPTQDEQNFFGSSFNNCSYNSSRNYFYEFRCYYQFLDAEEVNNTNIVFNAPYFYWLNGDQKIINSVCSKFLDLQNLSFKGAICTQYSTKPMMNLLNNSDSDDKHSNVRNYLITAGSRIPTVYDRVVKEITAIEDLEYSNNYLFYEKQDYIDKTQFFQNVYPVLSADCVGINSLSSKRTFTIYRDQQLYYVIACNLSVCFLPKQRIFDDNEQFSEQIVGTFVTEVGLLNQQMRIQSIASNISFVLQTTLVCTIMATLILYYILNIQSFRLCGQLAEPLDDLIYILKTLDEQSMEHYFVELLQGDLKSQTPNDLRLLIRAIEDFVGIVKLAHDASEQGNDSQAIIQYAIAYQFYLENNNLMGSAVILNNMASINLKNKRYFQCVHNLRESIEIMEVELDRYKNKYLRIGVTEQELQVDVEFQKLSTIVLNRCLNLCECLTLFLLQETSVMNEYLFNYYDGENLQEDFTQPSEKKEKNYEPLSMEQLIYAQLNLTSTQKADAFISYKRNSNLRDSTLNDKRIRLIYQELEQIIVDLDFFKHRFLFRNGSESITRRKSKESDQIQSSDMINLIRQLWKISTNTYKYCRFLMDNQLQYTKNDLKKLYIILKITLGHLYLGQIKQCIISIDDSETLLNEIKQTAAWYGFDEDVFQYPISALEQKFYLYKGILNFKLGRYRNAAEIITKSLKVKGSYSPRDRVFDNFDEDYSQIEFELKRYERKAKDMVIVLDYGRKMQDSLKLVRAIKLINNLYPFFQGENDRVAYYLVSNQVSQMINLKQSSQIRENIKNIFQMIPHPSMAETNVELGLSMAIQQIMQNPNGDIIHRDGAMYVKNSKNELEEHRRYIILLSDSIKTNKTANGYQEAVFSPFMQSKLNEAKIDLLTVCFDMPGNERQFQKTSENILNFQEHESHLILKHFEDLEQDIEPQHSNFYYEKII